MKLIEFSKTSKLLIAFLLIFSPVMDILLTEEGYKQVGKEVFLELEQNSFKITLAKDIEEGNAWKWIIYSWFGSIFIVLLVYHTDKRISTIFHKNILRLTFIFVYVFNRAILPIGWVYYL